MSGSTRKEQATRQMFKTEAYLFGVWPVKVGWIRSENDDYRMYWETEREAWEHLRERADKSVGKAQKALDKAHRNRAKALKKLQALPVSTSG